MNEQLARGEVIRLLNALDSEQDEDVLAAARQLHAQIAGAGLSWEDLLIPDEADSIEGDEELGDSDDLPDGDDLEDAPAEEPATPAEVSERNAEALELIEKMLAEASYSEDFREELNGYKSDIAEGVFDAADHRYLLAVHQRLTSKA